MSIPTPPPSSVSIDHPPHRDSSVCLATHLANIEDLLKATLAEASEQIITLNESSYVLRLTAMLRSLHITVDESNRSGRCQSNHDIFRSAVTYVGVVHGIVQLVPAGAGGGPRGGQSYPAKALRDKLVDTREFRVCISRAMWYWVHPASASESAFREAIADRSFHQLFLLHDLLCAELPVLPVHYPLSQLCHLLQTLCAILDRLRKVFGNMDIVPAVYKEVACFAIQFSATSAVLERLDAQVTNAQHVEPATERAAAPFAPSPILAGDANAQSGTSKKVHPPPALQRSHSIVRGHIDKSSMRRTKPKEPRRLLPAYPATSNALSQLGSVKPQASTAGGKNGSKSFKATSSGTTTREPSDTTASKQRKQDKAKAAVICVLDLAGKYPLALGASEQAFFGWLEKESAKAGYGLSFATLKHLFKTNEEQLRRKIHPFRWVCRNEARQEEAKQSADQEASLSFVQSNALAPIPVDPAPGSPADSDKTIFEATTGDLSANDPIAHVDTSQEKVILRFRVPVARRRSQRVQGVDAGDGLPMPYRKRKSESSHASPRLKKASFAEPLAGSLHDSSDRLSPTAEAQKQEPLLDSIISGAPPPTLMAGEEMRTTVNPAVDERSQSAQLPNRDSTEASQKTSRGPRGVPQKMLRDLVDDLVVPATREDDTPQVDPPLPPSQAGRIRTWTEVARRTRPVGERERDRRGPWSSLDPSKRTIQIASGGRNARGLMVPQYRGLETFPFLGECKSCSELDASNPFAVEKAIVEVICLHTPATKQSSFSWKFMIDAILPRYLTSLLKVEDDFDIGFRFARPLIIDLANWVFHRGKTHHHHRRAGETLHFMILMIAVSDKSELKRGIMADDLVAQTLGPKFKFLQEDGKCVHSIDLREVGEKVARYWRPVDQLHWFNVEPIERDSEESDG